jgi:hypothetical protein
LPLPIVVIAAPSPAGYPLQWALMHID